MKLDTTGVAEVARWALPLAVVAGATATGLWVGVGTALLVGAGGVLVLVILLLWSSVQALTGETGLTLEEALTLAAPSAEEEQKRSVLRALKDLEYERSVGKISEDDYRVLSTRYRAEAKRLLRALDADLDGSRERVEKMIAKRLEREDLPAVDEDDDGSEDLDRDEQPSSDAAPGDRPSDPDDDEGDEELGEDEDREDDDSEDDEDDAGPPATPTRACPSCDVRNDLDADFCKKCGAAIAPDGHTLCRSCPATNDDGADACSVCGVPAGDA